MISPARKFDLSLSSSRLVQILFCIALGFVIGRLFFVVPPWQVLLLVGGLFFLALLRKVPELGILAIVIMTSSIIFEEALPLIPIPIGSLHIPDIILLFLFILIPLQGLGRRGVRRSRTSLDWPLLLFYLAVLISVYVSIMVFHQNSTLVIRQVRTLTYFLLYFPIVYLIREERQVKFLLNGLFGVAALVGAAMIIQSLVGESVRLMPGRIEQATSLGEQGLGATRILPPGQLLIFVAFLAAFCVLALSKGPILKTRSFYILLIAGAGVLLTYNRSYWVSIIFSLGLFLVFLSKRGKKRVLMSLVITSLLVSVLLIPLSNRRGGRWNEYLSSFSERFSSLFSGETMYRDETLEIRRAENEYLFNKIKKNPLFGIGMVSQLRPSQFLAKEESGVYVHNGYLWILASLGIVGFFTFFWFYARFLGRGLSGWRKVRDTYLKAALAGFTLSGLGILLMSIVNPVLMQWKSVVVISTMIGLSEAIMRINESQVKT